MKSVEDMSVKELECEIKFVESRLDTNPCAPDYLRVLKKALKEKTARILYGYESFKEYSK